MSTVDGFTIKNIVLVRYKKLKGGKRVARNIKIIKDVKTSTEPGCTVNIKASVDSPRFGKIDLAGFIDKEKAILEMTTTKVELLGYLRTRHFEVVGYSPDVRMTNLRKRG